MFGKIVNEAKLSFSIRPNGPLLIKAGKETGIDPTLPDMQYIRGFRNGALTPIIPGSSLKGVIRSRSEKIIKTIGLPACDLFDKKKACSDKEKGFPENIAIKAKYNEACHACRLFGTTFIASRFKAMDAFPSNDCDILISSRTNVGINRITGGSNKGPLFQLEVVEDAVFQAEVTLTNYTLGQLALVLYVLKDLDDGYVSLGGATSRGYGSVKIEELRINLRDFRPNILDEKLSGLNEQDQLNLIRPFTIKSYYRETDLLGFEEVLGASGIFKGVGLRELLVRKVV